MAQSLKDSDTLLDLPILNSLSETYKLMKSTGTLKLELIVLYNEWWR